MPTSRFIRVPSLLVFGLVFLAGALAIAEPWEPCKFECPALYEYRITHFIEGKPRTTLELALDIVATEKKDAKGTPLFRVTRSTTSLMKMSKVGAEIVFGLDPVLSMAPELMYGNPMFAAMLEQLDLEVGKKLEFGGRGHALVESKQTVADIEGYAVVVVVKDGEAERKVADLTVHPDMPFPLHSRMYTDEGKPLFDMVLLRYAKH